MFIKGTGTVNIIIVKTFNKDNFEVCPNQLSTVAIHS